MWIVARGQHDRRGTWVTETYSTQELEEEKAKFEAELKNLSTTKSRLLTVRAALKRLNNAQEVDIEYLELLPDWEMLGLGGHPAGLGGAGVGGQPQQQPQPQPQPQPQCNLQNNPSASASSSGNQPQCAMPPASASGNQPQPQPDLSHLGAAGGQDAPNLADPPPDPMLWDPFYDGDFCLSKEKQRRRRRGRVGDQDRCKGGYHIICQIQNCILISTFYLRHSRVLRLDNGWFLDSALQTANR